MTTCNDSFYYGLVNPQIQLCPFRPSAVNFLLLLSVAHLKSCSRANTERLSWSRCVVGGRARR